MKTKLFFSLLCLPLAVAAAEPPEVNHYAFANYLGSGIYSSAGDTAAVANVPLSFDIEATNNGMLMLRVPLSVGFFNYRWQDLPDGEFPDAIGTVTLTPGVEYHWQATEKLAMEAYFDIGFGHNFSDSSNVGILSAGISTLYAFGAPEYSPLWVSRFYSAGYRSIQRGADDSYSALTTGVDSGVGLGFYALDRFMEPRLFMALHWYFGRGELADEPVGALMQGSTVEAGMSLAFDRPMGIEPATIDRLGVSYSRVAGEGVWRLFFSLPL
ncbi:hypothetical protein KJI95_01200 [Shewanella sp. JM162201]|uniref:Transporter n=1 Tax=Shewanella jiangmenensis TaxID=2837387 RepID=A0ABS5V0M3_9GAMM|nr:hypothetical protein [Shewanella jiangmenensis]MBT1443146.1 hypothetical protein [Shewanella jiangmenensis]